MNKAKIGDNKANYNMIAFKSYASGSSGNVGTLSDGETRIMLDCGLPWKQVRKALSFKTSEYSAICLSHSHGDHSAGISEAAKAGQDIYLLPETREALGLSGHRIHEIKLLQQFHIGTFVVKAFPLKHDVPNCGFLFANSKGERAVYITDTPYCPYRFNNLQIIMVEANFSTPLLKENTPSSELRQSIIQDHMSLETLLDMLRANNLSTVEEIHLLHLSDNNSDADMFKRRVQETTGKPVYVGG
mgnify:CR=1 FL=1